MSLGEGWDKLEGVRVGFMVKVGISVRFRVRVGVKHRVRVRVRVGVLG